MNLNGTGGATTLGTITGKNVTVDATGALGAVTYSAITTEGGGVVTVKGATLTATTVIVNTGAASTADNTISFTGGIDTDTFNVVATAFFDKKIASLTATGGVEAAGGKDVLSLDATAAALTVTALTIDGIEQIKVTDGVVNAITVNAAGVTGKAFELLGAALGDTLTVVGTAAADTIDLSKITVGGTAGAIIVQGGAGADTITLGANAETLAFNSLVGADTITGYNVAGDSITLSKAAFAALGAVGALGTDFASVANAAALTGGSIAAATNAEHIIYVADTGALYYNADAGTAGGLTLIGTFTDKPVLAAAEFAIVA